MKPYVFLNDVGTLIQVDVGTDVTGASLHQIKYVKPNGVSSFWDATVSNQYLRYTTIDGDIDQIGEWAIQAKVTLSGGTWHGEVTRFEVLKPIC